MARVRLEEVKVENDWRGEKKTDEEGKGGGGRLCYPLTADVPYKDNEILLNDTRRARRFRSLSRTSIAGRDIVYRAIV